MKEPCNETTCTRETKHADTSRCGGARFGVRDGSLGCGRFFCDAHLMGKANGFFCAACWRIKKRAEKTGHRAPLESAEVVAGDIARVIKGAVPPGWEFFLLLASIGEHGRMTYMSSIERDDAVKLLREIASKLDSKEPGV